MCSTPSRRSSQGSPAAEAGLQAGDQITKAKIIPPNAQQMKALTEKYPGGDLDQQEATLTFADNERNWPGFLQEMQMLLPGTTVEFTWKRGRQGNDRQGCTGGGQGLASIPSEAGSCSRRCSCRQPANFQKRGGGARRKRLTRRSWSTARSIAWGRTRSPSATSPVPGASSRSPSCGPRGLRQPLDLPHLARTIWQ